MKANYYVIVYTSGGKEIRMYWRIFDSFDICEKYAVRSLLPLNRNAYNTIGYDGYIIYEMNMKVNFLPF